MATVAHRAECSFAAIRRGRLYSSRRHLYGSRRWWLWRSYENLWPFADAWSATTTLASLGCGPAMAALPDLVRALTAYHRDKAVLGAAGPVGFESCVVPPLGGGGDVYYDDNAWIGLALGRHHDLTGDERALALAGRILAFVTSGWSTEASWSHPGGIRWKQPKSNVSRNTCSNGPVAELAALVHRRTGNAEALGWAVRIYDWVRSALLSDDGLYLDRITPDGRRDPTTWTYNQGTMIGAGVLLHQITGEAEYLEHAGDTARASLALRPATAGPQRRRLQCGLLSEPLAARWGLARPGSPAARPQLRRAPVGRKPESENGPLSRGRLSAQQLGPHGGALRPARRGHATSLADRSAACRVPVAAQKYDLFDRQ